MNAVNPKIDSSWLELIGDEFNKEYFLQLKQFLIEEKTTYKIYPSGNLIFNAFNSTNVKNTKVVIIGQDPYHGDGQAHGLCFSVEPGIKPPPSLVNIFKELKNDIGLDIPNHGCLQSWANQGILMLNATLTVRANQAGSHQNKGWEIFTDAVIKKLSEHKTGLVFILWGKYAQDKEKLIDATKHHILKAAHPSPFSAYNGFLGCKHFSKTNEILIKQNLKPINWAIS